MTRDRLTLTPNQEAKLGDHRAQARHVWNLAVEQHPHWHPGRKGAPGYLGQSRHLTQAPAGPPRPAAAPPMAQQEVLRDFAQAMTASFNPGNPARRRSWRKAGRDEAFRIVGGRGGQAAGYAVTARGGFRS